MRTINDFNKYFITIIEKLSAWWCSIALLINWSSYAFPGGHVENGRSFMSLSFRRNLWRKQGWPLSKSSLVGIKNWPLDTGGRYIVVVIRQLSSLVPFALQMRRSFLVQKGQIPETWIWPMIYLWWRWWKHRTNLNFSTLAVQKTIGEKKIF